MSGRASRLAAAVLLAVLATAGCRAEEADEGRPAASPAGGTTVPAELAELPVPRTEVAGATWDGRLVVAGGLTLDGVASALAHAYDPEADGWEEAPPLPVPLHHSALVALGDRLYAVGGYTNGAGGAWEPQAGMWSLGPEENSWREEAPMPGGPRGALGAAAAGDLLVVAGGESGGAVLGRTEVYDSERRAWRTGPDLALPREHLAVAAVGDRVYAIAGRAAGQGNFRAVQSLEPRSDRAWRDEPEVKDSRGGIGAAAVGDRMCVAGGEEPAGTIASVECLDGDRWVQAARLARPRHGLAVVALEDRLHVVGGGEQPGLFVSGVHEAFEL
jgi:hypothetical protein